MWVLPYLVTFQVLQSKTDVGVVGAVLSSTVGENGCHLEFVIKRQYIYDFPFFLNSIWPSRLFGEKKLPGLPLSKQQTNILF